MERNKSLRLVLILIFSIFNFSINSRAEEGDSYTAVGAGLGIDFPLSSDFFDNQADPGPAGNLHIRKFGKSSYGLELAYDHLEFSDTAAQVKPLTLSLVHRFSESGSRRWLAKVGVGVGFVDNFVTDSDYQRFAGKVSLGPEWDLNEKTKLGFSVNYHYVRPRSNGSDFTEIHTITPMLTLSFLICEGTKDPETVKSSWQKPQEKDSDRDGVTNTMDKCPNSPEGAKVNSVGCAEAENYSIQLEVQFATNSVEIESQYRSKISEVAEFLKKHNDTSAVIEGHTDNLGSVDYNTNLSQRRAESVKNYIAREFSIDENRLSAKGYGPGKPIADNETVSGRRKNRRVMVTFK